MNKLFVPYELALLAKEKGFDECCIAIYHSKVNNPEPVIWQGTNSTCVNKLLNAAITAPLYQQLVDWFREKHSICIGNVGDKVHGFSPYISKNSTIVYALWSPLIPNYYDSFNRALEEAFKLI